MAKEFNIITCNSGKEALRRVKKEKIDLLIVDILMRDMDGYEFVENLKNDSQLGHYSIYFSDSKRNDRRQNKGVRNRM